MSAADAPSPADRLPAAPTPRHLEMLAELAELGMELAREVATLAKSRIVEARESGWDGGLPKDPGAPFARLAQSVRRTIALDAALRDGAGALAKGRGGLFAPPDRGIDLHPRFALWEDEVVATPTRPGAPEPRETVERPLSVGAILADDLGRALDDRERLIETPRRPTPELIAELCRALGLDPARLAWIEERGSTPNSPNEAASPADFPPHRRPPGDWDSRPSGPSPSGAPPDRRASPPADLAASPARLE